MFKKTMVVAALMAVGVVSALPSLAIAYNFGDSRSETLVAKAWSAMQENDLEAALAYSNKCIELYAGQAQKMQASLSEYPTGSADEIFAYWALNDVATSYYVQGESYRKVSMLDEAKMAYQKVIDEYGYGQCWDNGGWFWKPGEAAKDKLAMLEAGASLDFGDYRSETLTTKAWKALGEKDLDAVVAYTNKCLEMYSAQAAEMQGSLTEYPWESKEKIFSYWALNDIGTCLYIKGEAFRHAGNNEEARKAYSMLVKEYFYSQSWDPQGWFWKPAEAAQQKLDELSEG